MDKVTILMPTYNRAEFFLPRAIKSVLAQTYDDWELIIGDDGSTDNTTEVVKNFSDRRIKYIRGEHLNNVHAFHNRFLKESKLKYISFLDDDCMYYPENLTKKMRVMKMLECNELRKQPESYAAVYSYALNVMYNEGCYIPVSVGYRGQPFDKNMYMFGGTYFNFIDISDILVDRVKALEVGGFKEGACFEDYALIAKLCMRYEDAIGCVPEVLTECTVHISKFGTTTDNKWRNSDSLAEHMNIY